ncbi:MAG TPA: EamA family transporter [Candidatus Saccharimonadales bacterium]|nr:EamA family transporter [Candidatus Saccharimonadales bacterium]
MTWQLFVAINLLTSSLVVPLQRLLLRKEGSDPIAFIVVSQILTGLIMLPFVLAHGFVMPDLAKYGLLMLAMFILYAIGHVLYAKTLKQVEASVFQTLLNTNTVWVVLMGYLVLKEHFSPINLIGTALVLVSVGLLVERKKPFRLERSVVLGLLVGLIFGVALSLWIYIGKHSDLLSWTMLSFFGTPVIIALVRPKTYKTVDYYFKGDVLVKLAVLAIVWAVDNLASLGAYKAGTVSIVAPILQSSVILSVLIAIIFLHERSHLKRKVAASVVCFFGVLLLLGA